MKRILICILSIIPLLSYGQLDRINSSPLFLHPSFAGSTGGTRIAAEFVPDISTTYPFTFSSSASFDHFSNRLKGGIGFQSIYHSYTIFDSDRHNSFQGGLVYAPKFTLRNKNQKKITWSPSAMVTYFQTDFIDNKRYELMSYSFGLMLNQEKWLLAGLYNLPGSGFRELPGDYHGHIELLGGYQFDKNPDNDLSSTLIAGYRIFPGIRHNTVLTYFLSGFVNVNYSVRYRKIVVSCGSDGVSLGLRTKNLQVKGGVNSFTSDWVRFNFGTVIMLNKKPGIASP